MPMYNIRESSIFELRRKNLGLKFSDLALKAAMFTSTVDSFDLSRVVNISMPGKVTLVCSSSP